MTTMRKVPLADIKIPPRLRKDMGDIDGLVRSLATYDLIEPIVLDVTDNEFVLIAGHRRLEAAKRLGWNDIDCVFFDDLDEQTRLEMELEENVQRKDLAPIERSRQTVKKVEAARAKLRRLAEHADQVNEHTIEPVEAREEKRNGVLPDAGKTSGGRPTKNAVASEREIAETAGLKRSTAQNAERHVEIARKYPITDSPAWTQRQAFDAEKALDQLRDLDREKLFALIESSQRLWPPQEVVTAASNLLNLQLPDRGRIWKLAESTELDKRQKAQTELLNREPPLDERWSDVQEAKRLVARARKRKPRNRLNHMFAKVEGLLTTVQNEMKKDVKSW